MIIITMMATTAFCLVMTLRVFFPIELAFTVSSSFYSSRRLSSQMAMTSTAPRMIDCI